MPPSRSYARCRLRSLVLLAAAGLAPCILSPHPGHAGSCKVIAVRSANLQPHLDVVRGIRDVSSCDLREMTLRDEEGAEKVLAGSPDVIIAVGTSAMKKLRSVTGIPVIHAMVVPSEALRWQGPGISGVSMDLSPAMHLSALRQVFPHARRIGVLYDPRHTGAFLEDAVKEAGRAGLELVSRQVDAPSKLAPALAAMQGGVDVFWMLPDPTVVTAENIELLLRFSFQQNVPIFTFSRKYLEMGAVASLDLDPYDIGAQAGELANRLLSGSGAGREYARTGHLTVNRKVAGKMGLTIGEEVTRKVKKID